MNFKMGGVHASILKYINVLLFDSVEILDAKSLGSRGTHNNEEIYIAIANEIVNCSSIQAFHMVCFTNYNFEILIIYSFVLTCSFVLCDMCYIYHKYFRLEVTRYFTNCQKAKEMPVYWLTSNFSLMQLVVRMSASRYILFYD